MTATLIKNGKRHVESGLPENATIFNLAVSRGIVQSNDVISVEGEVVDHATARSTPIEPNMEVFVDPLPNAG